jgi:hypothetical protein
LFRA